MFDTALPNGVGITEVRAERRLGVKSYRLLSASTPIADFGGIARFIKLPVHRFSRFHQD